MEVYAIAFTDTCITCRQQLMQCLFNAHDTFGLELRRASNVLKISLWENPKCFLLKTSETWSNLIKFLPARRYASAGINRHRASVCLSVRLSVCHTPVLGQKAKRSITQTTPRDSPGL